jgi:YD repeat-containing protein
LQQVDYANTGGSFYKRREIINDYTLFPARQNTLNGFEMRVPLSDGTNQPATSGCSHILIFYTALQSQWNYQLDHEEKMYNGGIDTFNYIDNHTYYSYENPAHFLPTRSMTFNSKGDTVTTITKYPLDYANGGNSDAFSMGINKLNTAHVVNAPVEVYKQINPLSGTPYVISGTITAYSTTLPKPVQGSRLDLQQTIGSFVPSSITGGITTKDPNYAPLISYDQYDNNGNLLQQHKVNDLNQSYVWGYNNSLPIAQVSNAAAKDIFYTSFEDADGNSTDGDSRTGKKSRTGGYSKSLSGLTNGAYVLTWWTKSAGQWSLLRQNVTVSGGAYTISLTGQVDEVRFYPRNALMTTYTYDPLIGRTSECDAGSKIIYYEYDGLGRLKIVRDQDRNIIKTVDYHYKGH